MTRHAPVDCPQHAGDTPVERLEHAGDALLAAHLRRSELAELVRTGATRPWGVVELHARGATDDLRTTLLATGRWVEDPLPTLRRRHKPWVVWSVRERRPGVALHLEQERHALVVHLDACSPGAVPLLYPLHALVDLVGWRRVRPRLLALAVKWRRWGARR